MKRNTMRTIIKKLFLMKQDKTMCLKELYSAFRDSEYESNCETIDCSIRTILYRHPEEFERISKGYYMLKSDTEDIGTVAVLIDGDGRTMQDIPDDSVSFLVSDHPWLDTKAHVAGNQADFTNYDCWRYTLDDFKAKYRVLKDGCYLCEFLPIERESNWRYIAQIKEMAAEAGFTLYHRLLYRNAPERGDLTGRTDYGSTPPVSTGRCTKGVQDVYIFYKGKTPRQLHNKQNLSYKTCKQPVFEMEVIENKKSCCKAEKPVRFFEYLYSIFTLEKELIVDSYCGSCNSLKAAVNMNRFAVGYETAKQFICDAVERFGMTTLFEKNDKAAYAVG